MEQITRQRIAMAGPRRREIWRTAFSIALSLFLLAAGVLPEMAQAQSSRRTEGPPPVERKPGAPPWPRDFEIGLEAARAFAFYFGLVDDEEMLQRVTNIAYQVAAQTGHPDYLYTFNILDIDDPNALALPGGFIFITRGMMEQNLSDDALAHLLGHELAHVTERHFARSERLAGLLSLLQTAVLVAAIVAVPQSRSGGYDYDEHSDRYRLSASGKDAAIQGTTIFGGLFRELLVRGYGRGLEVEADRIGRRYAGRAGFAMSGGVELMNTLRDRIYEDMEYGYWRTHPFFQERVDKARAASDAGGSPPPDTETRAYRAQIQDRMARLADTILNDDLAIFLYESALRIGPDGAHAVVVHRQKLERRVEAVRKQADVFRRLTPIIAEYDSLVARVHEEVRVPEEEVRRLETGRDELIAERENLFPKAKERIAQGSASTRILETFLENYPDDPEATELKFVLAEQYALTNRADQAALELDEQLAIWSADEDAPLRERAVGMLGTLVPKTEDLTTNQILLERSPSDSVRSWAGARLEVLASELDSLEIGSRFLARYPDSEQADTVRERVEELARKQYHKARIQESLGKMQEALDTYHEVLLMASATEAARKSRAGIERIQALEAR